MYTAAIWRKGYLILVRENFIVESLVLLRFFDRNPMKNDTRIIRIKLLYGYVHRVLFIFSILLEKLKSFNIDSIYTLIEH